MPFRLHLVVLSIRSRDIPGYSRKFPKLRQILDVFALPNSGVLALANMYPLCRACRAARHVTKFRGVTLSIAKVLGTDRPTLNFAPIFDPLL